MVSLRKGGTEQEKRESKRESFDQGMGGSKPFPRARLKQNQVNAFAPKRPCRAS